MEHKNILNPLQALIILIAGFFAFIVGCIVVKYFWYGVICLALAWIDVTFGYYYEGEYE